MGDPESERGSKRYIQLVMRLGHDGARGWQSRVARQLDVHPSLINRIARGRVSRISREVIERSARALDLDRSYFFDETPPREVILRSAEILRYPEPLKPVSKTPEELAAWQETFAGMRAGKEPFATFERVLDAYARDTVTAELAREVVALLAGEEIAALAFAESDKEREDAAIRVVAREMARLLNPR